MFYKHFKKMNVNVLSYKCLKGKMNNKSLSKIYNVKYMDYPDFLIHFFLSFIIYFYRIDV